MNIRTTVSIIGLACWLALFTGCTTVSPEQINAEIAKVGYGADPVAELWQAKVKAFMELRLKDPASAEYKFGEPTKSYLTNPPISGGGLKAAGYDVDVLINAKNSYGGYTGFEAHKFFIRDNEIVSYATRVGNLWLWQ